MTSPRDIQHHHVLYSSDIDAADETTHTKQKPPPKRSRSDFTSDLLYAQQLANDVKDRREALKRQRARARYEKDIFPAIERAATQGLTKIDLRTKFPFAEDVVEYARTQNFCVSVWSESCSFRTTISW